MKPIKHKIMGESKVINKKPPQDGHQEAREQEALDAVRTLIRWTGDNPARPGMQDTPRRVLEFYRDFFKGYSKTADDYAASIANDVTYDDFILVKNINLTSFCEHHMLPATGTAHIAYIPSTKIAGLGTIAKIATDCAARFTTQESITNDIAAMIEKAFAPEGVAVCAELSHGCMTLRCPELKESRAVTTKFSGAFLSNSDIQKQFFMLINKAQDQ